MQIAAMARIRGVAILVHTEFWMQVFGRGTPWQIRHRGNPGHFDVVEPDPEGEEPNNTEGNKQATAATQQHKGQSGEVKVESGKITEATQNKAGAQASTSRAVPLVNKKKRATLGGKREAKILTINIG